MGVNPSDGHNYKIRRPRGAGATAPGGADWRAVTPGILLELLATASSRGGALRLGYTRDGGAYAIGVYFGDEYWTDYVRPSEDIDTYLDDLRISFQDVGTPQPTAPTARGHTRKPKER